MPHMCCLSGTVPFWGYFVGNLNSNMLNIYKYTYTCLLLDTLCTASQAWGLSTLVNGLLQVSRTVKFTKVDTLRDPCLRILYVLIFKMD